MGRELIHLATSAFTAAGWPESFYPATAEASGISQFLRDAVRSPSKSTARFITRSSASTVRGWHAKTTARIHFRGESAAGDHARKSAARLPAGAKAIPEHDGPAGRKAGAAAVPVRLFNKKAFPDLDAFLARLVPFLKTLPSGYRFALEIRNKNWLSRSWPMCSASEALRWRSLIRHGCRDRRSGSSGSIPLPPI